MSDVKRYDAHYITEGVMGGKALACAEMVLASDYARLEQECGRLRQALEKAALAMWNSEANMDNEAAEAEVALAEEALSDKP